ncbi:MAG: GNAT family N-acetyltransferase, partial [Chloroflexota bacterium]
EADLEAYIRKSVPEYAYDQMVSGNWTAEEAAAKARAEFQQMLPNGINTENAFLYVILDELQNRTGMLWYYIDPARTRKTAFLIDFFIFSDSRKKGYEKEALTLFELTARQQGVEKVELQVFTHKSEEVNFYIETGYKTTSVLFSKTLGKD